MIDHNLQQFAFLTALLSNWDGIILRSGPLPPALEAEMAEILRDLSAAEEPERIARLIDDLLDLVEETPAYNYVRSLISRATLPVREITRGLIGQVAAERFVASALTNAATEMARLPLGGVAFLSVPIFFATNRNLLPDNEAARRYGGEYSEKLSYGQINVTIPVHQHQVGKIERPGWFEREQKEQHVVLLEPEALDPAAFATRLGEQARRAERSDLLLFLHGYQVTFEEAARRAAQVAVDIKFGGTVVLFSWPSAGALSGYFADEACSEKSSLPLTNFLRDLEDGPWQKVHLLAHSMGNRVMVAALARGAQLSLPLRNVVLVAADLDRDRFDQQYPALQDLLRQGNGELLTSYVTNSDRALLLSWWLHRTERVGRFRETPYTREGLETIDATAVANSFLGHSYFGEERSLLTDLGLLLRESLPAARRGLTEVDRWWAFPR